jgi:hypothetical protein
MTLMTTGEISSSVAWAVDENGTPSHELVSFTCERRFIELLHTIAYVEFVSLRTLTQ